MNKYIYWRKLICGVSTGLAVAAATAIASLVRKEEKRSTAKMSKDDLRHFLLSFCTHVQAGLGRAVLGVPDAIDYGESLLTSSTNRSSDNSDRA